MTPAGLFCKNAIKLDVEIHNRDNPGKEWAYINVPPAPAPTPDTSRDPKLGKCSCACANAGEVVKGHDRRIRLGVGIVENGAIALDMELYNRDTIPTAHIVWGTE